MIETASAALALLLRKQAIAPRQTAEYYRRRLDELERDAAELEALAFRTSATHVTDEIAEAVFGIIRHVESSYGPSAADKRQKLRELLEAQVAPT